jgi:hypothetical protein
MLSDLVQSRYRFASGPQYWKVYIYRLIPSHLFGALGYTKEFADKNKNIDFSNKEPHGNYFTGLNKDSYTKMKVKIINQSPN